MCRRPDRGCSHARPDTGTDSASVTPSALLLRLVILAASILPLVESQFIPQEGILTGKQAVRNPSQLSAAITWQHKHILVVEHLDFGGVRGSGEEALLQPTKGTLSIQGTCTKAVTAQPRAASAVPLLPLKNLQCLVKHRQPLFQFAATSAASGSNAKPSILLSNLYLRLDRIKTQGSIQSLLVSSRGGVKVYLDQMIIQGDSLSESAALDVDAKSQVLLNDCTIADLASAYGPAALVQGSVSLTRCSVRNIRNAAGGTPGAILLEPPEPPADADGDDDANPGPASLLLESCAFENLLPGVAVAAFGNASEWGDGQARVYVDDDTLALGAGVERLPVADAPELFLSANDDWLVQIKVCFAEVPNTIFGLVSLPALLFYIALLLIFVYCNASANGVFAFQKRGDLIHGLLGFTLAAMGLAMSVWMAEQSNANRYQGWLRAATILSAVDMAIEVLILGSLNGCMQVYATRKVSNSATDSAASVRKMKQARSVLERCVADITGLDFRSLKANTVQEFVHSAMDSPRSWKVWVLNSLWFYIGVGFVVLVLNFGVIASVVIVIARQGLRTDVPMWWSVYLGLAAMFVMTGFEAWNASLGIKGKNHSIAAWASEVLAAQDQARDRTMFLRQGSDVKPTSKGHHVQEVMHQVTQETDELRFPIWFRVYVVGMTAVAMVHIASQVLLMLSTAEFADSDICGEIFAVWSIMFAGFVDTTLMIMNLFEAWRVPIITAAIDALQEKLKADLEAALERARQKDRETRPKNVLHGFARWLGFK